MIKKFFIYWLPVVAWMGLIYFLSSFHKLQASPVGWQDFVIRKTAHFLEYAVLFVLVNRGFVFTSNVPLKKRLFFSFLIAIFYAVTDEFHQTKVNGRTGRSFDIGVDGFGVIGGLLFVVKLAELLPGKLRKIVVKN